jgi:outer membrane protein assembly factor BamB
MKRKVLFCWIAASLVAACSPGKKSDGPASAVPKPDPAPVAKEAPPTPPPPAATLSASATTSQGTSASGAASSGNWPQWRGPNRDDISTETGLLKEWPPGGPKLVWKSTGLGRGYSSVSVSGARIYTMGDSPDSSRVLALDPRDGKILWTSAAVGKPGGDYPGTRCTPTVDGDSVFALGQFGDLVCLEAATGKDRWRKHLERDFGGSMAHWGFAESPLVDGERVMVTPGGRKGAIVALDKKTGSVAWQSVQFTDAAQYSSLIIGQLGNVRQYIQLTDQSVAAVAADSGRLLWRAPRRGQTAVIPTPILSGDTVYVTSGYNVGCNAFRISVVGGRFSVQPAYANKVMVNHHGGVVLVGENLYGFSDSGGWVCQNFKTGQQVWSERGKLPKGSLTYADGHLYLRSEQGPGTVVLIEASPQGFKETGRFDQPERSGQNSWPHPVVTGGRLYLRDQDKLFCYAVKP